MITRVHRFTLHTTLAPQSVTYEHTVQNISYSCFTVPYADEQVAADERWRDENMAKGAAAYFGVYDGHGGEGIAEALQMHLHKAIISHQVQYPSLSCKGSLQVECSLHVLV